MTTVIISERVQRWKGTLDDLAGIVEEAVRIILDKTGVEPGCSATATRDRVETRFDSFTQFKEQMASEYPSLATVVLTVGEFDRNTPLSAEIVMSKDPSKPGAEFRVRGFDPAYVDWLGKRLHEFLKRGSRKLTLGPAALQFLFLAIVIVGQYFFYTRVGLPEFGNLGTYIELLLASVAPISLVFLGLFLVNRLVPQLELLPPDAQPLIQRYRGRVTAAAALALTGLLLPVLVSVIKAQMGLE